MSEPQGAKPCYLAKHGFDFDMFFSYSHGDVLDEGDAPLKLWSIQVYKALVQALSLVVKPPPRIFLDESTRPGDGMKKAEHLLTSLLTKVEKSALFQVVMSPHYLDSAWCLRELDTFVASLPDQANGVSGRIFIAKAMETAGLPWPEPLCDVEGNKTVGWQFHPRDRAFPYGFMNDWRGSPPSQVSELILDMAAAIERQLRELDGVLTEKKSREGQLEGLVGGNIEQIYLYGRADEASEWQATWEDIRKLDIAIMPGQPEPIDDDDDPDKRLLYARMASRCDAMLMVGSDGFNLDFDLDVIGRERRNLIASRYKKYLPCAVVDRRGDLKVTAREGNAKRFGIDWINARSGSWPNDVRTWLKDSAGKVGQRYGLAPPPTETGPAPDAPVPRPE